MKTIVREKYLERIKALKDTSDIKIITGIMISIIFYQGRFGRFICVQH